MKKRIGTAWIVVVVACLLFQAIIPCFAEPAEHVDSLARAAWDACQSAYGPFGFDWTPQQFKQLSDDLYFLDALSPLQDEKLRLIAGQCYAGESGEKNSASEAVRLIKQQAVAQKLIPSNAHFESYILDIRLFDEPYAPIVRKVSLRLINGQIVCGEVHEKKVVKGLRILEQAEQGIRPFVLDQSFLYTAEKPERWHHPYAPSSFWTALEHRVLRCADMTRMLNMWAATYGMEINKWPLEAKSICQIWNGLADLGFSHFQDRIAVFPQQGDISQETAVAIARQKFGPIALKKYTVSELATMEIRCEFAYGIYRGGSAKWTIWFEDPLDRLSPARGYVIIDAETAEVIDSYAGHGHG